MPEGFEGPPEQEVTVVKEQEATEVRDRFLWQEGKRVHYLEAGTGEPVLLIHGWLGSSDDFSAAMPEFAKRFHAIAPDLPGCGLRERELAHAATLKSSQELEEKHTVSAYVEFLHRFVASVNLQRVNIVGLSMGATVCLEWAKKYPQDIVKIAVFEPVLGKEISLQAKILAEIARIKPLRRIVRWLIVQAEINDSAFKKLPQKHKEAMINEIYGSSLRVAFEAGRDSIKGVDTQSYKNIKTPTLLMSGGLKTPISDPEAIKNLAKIISNSRFMEFPLASHIPGLVREDPRSFSQVICDFLEANPYMSQTSRR